MHDRLVRLVLEVRLPTLGEVRSGPPLKVFQFLFRWADLDTCVNAVCGKWTCSFQCPLIKDFL
jgi:hypothetical protein